VEVSGANAGVHLLVWLQDVAPQQLSACIDCAAQAGVGLYPVTPYYLLPPPRAGLLLGYAALTDEDIRAGVQRLAAVLDRGEWRSAAEPWQAWHAPG
jgi:GntR family transcriptional regulator/MocR family aminotransferase